MADVNAPSPEVVVKWINCDEQLPRNDSWVLGWNAVARGSWIYSYSHKKREWFSYSGANYHQKITHWAELPEGPQ